MIGTANAQTANVLSNARNSITKRATPSMVKKESVKASHPTNFHSVSPYGSSLFPLVWERDPTHPVLKRLYIILTVGGLCSVSFYPWVAVKFWGLDGEWDATQGVGSGGNAILLLFERTMALPSCFLHRIAVIALITFGLLILGDILGGIHCLQEVWPKSWNTHNRECYEEMFSEPTRNGRLLRRPGNVLSNIVFFFGSLCICTSVYMTTIKADVTENINTFIVADGMFGTMLFILAICSTIWHGSNAPWSHYPDLWAMESCIFYLIIRYSCLAELSLLKRSPNFDDSTAEVISAGSCVAIYSLLLIDLGRFHLQNYHKRYLHGGCPFSVRACLMKKSDFWGKGHSDCLISTVCLFQALPIGYLAIPILIEIFILKSIGSLLAGYMTCISLIIGWSYRLFDRWALDGCAPLNYFATLQARHGRGPVSSSLQTLGTAIFSPTGNLHFFTGITLLAGYIHARSVENAA